MAMSGIRDMSVIDEPPQDRQPITTYVMEHDWGVIMQAIEKELRRSGQVYYIHNRIDSIYSCAEKIRSLIPEARVGVAHGKMTEEQMLEIWRQLLDGSLDVLVWRSFTSCADASAEPTSVPTRISRSSAARCCPRSPRSALTR